MRVMIVDDEVVFRNNIKMMIDWDSFGYKVCAEASDGLEAKQLLEQLQPDIVITDICMSDMDGLSLISFIYENYPHIQMIALSGYDQYEFVRSSMKKGVVDYLLKHQLTQNTLLTSLKAAELRLAGEGRPRKDYLLDQLTQGRTILQRNLLRDVLNGSICDTTVIRQKMKELDISLNISDTILVVAEIDGISSWKQKYTNQEWRRIFDKVIELVETVVSNSTENIVVPQPDQRFVIFFSLKTTHSSLAFYNHIVDCIQQVRNLLKKHYNITACYSMSEHISDFSKLPEMYKKTCGKLADKIYRGYDVVIREKTMQTSPAKDYNISLEEEQAIIQQLQSGEGLIDYIQDIFETRRHNHIDASRLQIVFAELLNILNKVLREDGLDMVDIYPDFNNLFASVSMMTLNEMKDCIIDLYQKAIKARARVNCVMDQHTITRQARKYINKNYAKNISLCDIAEEFGVTASYLSRVFKEDVGKTIVEYLNSYRIQRAQKMIIEGIKLKDLYEHIGFNSNTYFFTVFKQITGQTPMQFKKKLGDSYLN